MAKIRIDPISRGREFDTEGFKRDVEALMTNVVAEGQRFIAKYPPQRLRKTGYRRTGTLKRSWSFRVTTSGNRISGVIGSNSNIAPYNRIVQGSPQGRLFRRANWRNIDDLRKVSENDFRDGLDAIADQHARR